MWMIRVKVNAFQEVEDTLIIYPFLFLFLSLLFWIASTIEFFFL